MLPLYTANLEAGSWQPCALTKQAAQLIAPRDPNVPLLEGLNLIGYSNRFDASRIRSELGWHPRVSYRDAIAGMEATWKARTTGDDR